MRWLVGSLTWQSQRKVRWGLNFVLGWDWYWEGGKGLQKDNYAKKKKEKKKKKNNQATMFFLLLAELSLFAAVFSFCFCCCVCLHLNFYHFIPFYGLLFLFILLTSFFSYQFFICSSLILFLPLHQGIGCYHGGD